MTRFWSIAVDDATADSQQNPKETPHRHIMKENVNDTSETVVSDMLKNVHEAYETLEAIMSALEKATLVVAMERKVTLVVKRIRNQI